MLNYAICEFGGKQIKVVPNEPFEVDFQGEENKDIEAKVLLIQEDGRIKLGKPYLKEKLSLKILGIKKGDKIRVGKFHAKANFRRITGQRPKFTQVVLTVKN